MPRPKKNRTIKLEPRVYRFSPRGIRGRPDYVSIYIDELEAIRLADLDGRLHADAAKEMSISRQTFERILEKARHKLADGIISGKIIDISEKKERRA